MSKPIDPPKCTFPGCGDPHEIDRIACAKHREPCEPWGTIERLPTAPVIPIKRGKR